MQSLTEKAAEQELGRGFWEVGAPGAEPSRPHVYKLPWHPDPDCALHRANHSELLAGVLRSWKVGEKARIASPGSRAPRSLDEQPSSDCSEKVGDRAGRMD